MRTTFKPVSQPELIRPVATPVNTYVRPADPAPSNLHQLAEGLGDLAGGLSSLVQARDAKQQEADAAQAEALFNENNQMGFAEAVRKGLIPAQASPSFVKTYKQAQGNLAGVQLQQKFNAEYMKWEGRNSNDPAAFQTWMSDFVRSNVDPNTDPDVLRGLNPHVRQLWGNGYDVFSRDSDASLRSGAKATLGAIANRLADAAQTQSLADGGEVKWDEYWKDLMAEREKATSAGMRYEDADEALINAVVTKAAETGDMKWLDLMKRQIPGRDINYEDLPEFKLAQAQAQEKISTDHRQALNEKERLTKEANEKEKDDLTAMIYEGLSKDPNFKPPEDALNRIETLGNPTIRKSVAEARTTFSNAIGEEDRGIVLGLTSDAVSGKLSMKDLQKAIDQGQIKSASTYNSLSSTVQQVLKERAQGNGILTSRRSEQARKVLADRIMANDTKVARMLDGSIANLSDEALEAQDEFDMRLMEFAAQNPDASLAEREKFIAQTRDELLGAVDQDKGTFDSQGDKAGRALQFQKREEMGPRDDKNMDQPTQDSVDRTEGQRFFGNDAPPDLGTVPEDYRKAIEDGAKRLNTTPDDINERVWKLYLEKSGKKVPEGYLKKSSLEDSFGNIMNASLPAGEGLDDTQKARLGGAAKLLASFTGPEGSSTDGYNTTLANGKLTGGKVNLVGMTLDEIDALQSEMLKHPDNRWNSSAVGQYQIVQKTLRTLRDEMGLTGSEVFDEKLQDQMGLALLDRRGYSKWLNGEVSDEAFISELRNEWDGLNKVSKASLVSALQDVKEGGSSAFDSILAEGGQEDSTQGGLQDLVKSDTQYEGTGKLRFANPGQETIQGDLKARLEKVSEDLGEPLRITSGYRSRSHPVERKKGNGGGEHTHGNAVDIDLKGMDEGKRADLIRKLHAQGLKRFIVYRNSPNMLHVDLKDQRGDGSPHFMFDKSARNMASAPRWYRELAAELEAQRSV